jgi:hypothetical protein
MSQLLDRAFAEPRRLPDAEQDAIAAMILEEIEDDRKWGGGLRSFARKVGRSDRTRR